LTRVVVARGERACEVKSRARDGMTLAGGVVWIKLGGTSDGTTGRFAFGRFCCIHELVGERAKARARCRD